MIIGPAPPFIDTLKIVFSFRRIVSIPAILALLVVTASLFLLPRLIPVVGEAAVQRLLDRRLGPGYTISITGVAGPLYRQIGLETVAIARQHSEGPRNILEIDGFVTSYDIVSLFSSKPLRSLRSVVADEIRITVPEVPAGGSLNGSPGEETIENGEKALYSLMEYLGPETDVSFPIRVLGNPHVEQIDTLFVRLLDRRLTVETSVHEYTLAATISSVPREAHFVLNGPGISVTARVIDGAISVAGTVVPRHTPIGPLFDSGSFTVTQTLRDPELPLSSLGEIVLASSRGQMDRLDGAEGNLTLSRISTLLDIEVAEGHIVFDIADSVARVSARIDGGPMGSVVIDDLRIPLENPWAGRPGKFRVAIPEGATLPSTLVPEKHRDVLAQTGVIGLTDKGRSITLPGITVSASTDANGVVSVGGELRRNGIYQLVWDAAVDVPGGKITVTTANISWTDGRWNLSGALSGTLPLDELTDPFPHFPKRVSAEGEISVTDANTPENTLSVFAFYSDGAITLERGYVAFSGTQLSLGRPMTVTSVQDRITIEDALLSVAGGIIALDAELGRSDFSAQVTLDRLAVDKLSVPDVYPVVRGILSGNISAFGSYRAPRVSATIEIDDLSAYGESGHAVLSIEQDAESLRISRGEIRMGSLLQGEFTGRLPVTLDGDGIRFLSLKDSSFDGNFSSDRVDRFFADTSGASTVTSAPPGKLTTRLVLPEGTGRFHLRSEFVPSPNNDSLGLASGFGYDSIVVSGEITEPRRDGLTASLSLLADDRELFRGTGEIGLPRLQWQAIANGEIPLEFLAPHLPGLAALTGSLEVSLTGSGNGRNVVIDGTTVLRNGQVRPVGSMPPITGLEGVVRFDQTGFVSQTLRGEIGLAPFSATLSGNLGNGDVPGEVEATVSGQNLLLVSSPTIRARGDVDIRLRGRPGEGFDLEGTVDVQNGTYSRDIPLIDFDAIPRIDTEVTQLFSVPGPFGRNVRLNIRVLANRSINVENNIYSGPFSADLVFRGTLEIPQPQGRIFTDRGRLTLPLTVINVENAVVRFPQDRPFSPDIQARGVARMRNYQLYATVSGTLPNVEVDIASTPSLPQSDALVLLTTGFVPDELTGSGNRVALAIGSRLGAQFVRSLIGTAGGAGGADFADRVDVIIGEGVTQSGAETIEIEFRLTEADSWFLVFRRDRYDRYNMDLAWRYWIE